ncbi:hypothetical protein EDM29_14600, partial [Staphylococcus aureus]
TQSLAFGPVTVMNQTDYAITEGHKNAQTHIIEGFALGQAFQQHHLPVTAYEGQGYVGFRMYEEGPKSLVEGWTKHLAVGASATQGRLMAMIIIWMIGTMTSTLALILGLLVKSLSFKRICVSYGIYAQAQTQSLAFGPVTVMNQTDYAITEGHKNAQTHIIEG